MKIFLFFLLFTSFNLAAYECEIELYSKIYRTTVNQVLQSRDLVKNSTCPLEISNKLATLASSSEGVVLSSFLKTEVQKDFPNITITFITNKLSLLDLNSVLKNQLLPDTNLFFSKIRSLNGIATIGLSDGESIRATCDSCQMFGEKNIKIDITDIVSNTNRTVWFTSKIMAKIKVVKAKRSISFQQKNLDINDFYFEEVMTSSPENALTTLDNINFYKSNKTIIQDAIVSNLDIQPINLVNFGTPANVTLLSENISLQKMAMPLRSARFGETIELKGPNNKNIAGKVVDFNKVVIEL